MAKLSCPKGELAGDPAALSRPNRPAVPNRALYCPRGVTAEEQAMAETLDISGWIPEAPTSQPALEGDLTVDVAVVGAGYTGLSTAIELRKAGLSVAVLEREFAGFGASGRNAGHVAPTIGKDLSSLITFYGREKAQRLLHLVETAIEYTEETIRTHDIDCAYRATGNIMAAVHPSQAPRLEKSAKIAQELGAHMEFLTEADMRARGLPPAFLCGTFESMGGTLNPGKYVLGLRKVAIDAGAQLFERTPVTRIDDGAPAVLHTPHGQVRAERVVIATNAYTPNLGWLGSVQVPLSVSLAVTAPVTPAQRELIGWDGYEGVYTVHEILENFRMTEDDRILVGTKTVRFGWNGTLPPLHDAENYACLERTFRDRFPGLEDLPIEQYWTGYIGFTPDFLPAFGRTGAHKNILYGIGYAGHGVPMGSYAGTILAGMIQERETPADVLIDRFRPPWPPEPFRWLIGKALLTGLTYLDNRVDTKIRNAAIAS